MKRLIIVCEGQTEQQFCEEVLQPYFSERDNDILIQTPLIKKSGGGIVGWASLKKQVLHHLNEKDAVVSTFIDYYGISEGLHFPKWAEGNQISDKHERIGFLEQAIKEDVDGKAENRFLPHIQVHEFESLLFSNINVFSEFYDKDDIDMSVLQKTIEECPFPEDINTSPLAAPSKRILAAIPSYHKVVDGNIIALEIGIDTMMEKCPHFRSWVKDLSEAIHLRQA